VLSFPADRDVQKQFAGEIAISAEIATKNARALGHSAAEEVKILVLHGVLHLRGFDHECDNGQMARREKQLRAKLHLPQGLIERTDSRRDSRPRLSSGAKPRHATASKGRINENRRISNESTMKSVSASAAGGRPRRNQPQ
jgi:probable rRNA maturation factor